MKARPVPTIVSRSMEETESLGARIGRAAEAGDVIALWGELGAGKTAVVRGIARGLGLAEGAVTSPTFVIVREHDGGRVPLHHVDLYRLDPQGLGSTGWEEGLDLAVTAIEWPDRLGAGLPADRLDLRLAHAGPEERTIEIAPTGPRSARLAAAA